MQSKYNKEFEGCPFNKSIFHRTNLPKANFIAAVDSYIGIFNHALKRAKFSLPKANGLLASFAMERVA